jgi:two-component system response regulator WspF
MTDGAVPIVAIGASAGGPAAVAEVLRGLPPGFGAAVVIVQHIDEEFAPALVRFLAEVCALPVMLAREGDVPGPGEVFLVAGPRNMVLGPGGALRSTDEAGGAYRPSIDIFFTSVAARARMHAAGVLLTGMGRDGARGLTRMREAGALTIAQDRATSAVYGMPKAAISLDGRHLVLPLKEIAPRLAAIAPRSPLINRSLRHG